jgi:dTMP kinase
MEKGLFITFEGPEGAGKSTQIRLVKEYLEQKGLPSITVREPGGTLLGDRIREILLSPESGEMAQRSEILLYAASRAQLVEKVIFPALTRGDIVLCDRYVDSSIAYQGYGAQWEICDIVQINKWATGGLKPQRTYLLDLPVELGQKRIQIRGNKKDRMELKEKMFHERVRSGFLSLSDREPDRFRVIDARMTEKAVFQEIVSDLELLLKRRRLL